MFCRPIAFSMPAAVSHRRGGGLPIIGSFDRPFTTNPPSLLEVDDVLELDAVAEGSAGGDDGILECDAGNVDAEIGSGRAVGCGHGLAFSRSRLRRCVAVRSERLGQHASHGMRGSVDSEQRRERGHHVDRFDAGAIGSGLERQAVKRQRHVRVVVVGRGVVGAFARTRRCRYRGRPSRTNFLRANSCSDIFVPGACRELRLRRVATWCSSRAGPPASWLRRRRFRRRARARERRRRHPRSSQASG